MNLKSLLLTGVATMTALSAMAIPARKGERTFTQTDGTVITVNLVGDEHHHAYVTTDGLALQRGTDGNLQYATVAGASGIVAHNIGQRTAAEAAFILNNVDNLQASKVIARQRAKAPRKSPIRKASQVPNNGTPRVPILLVQYKDKKFIDSDPKATFDAFFAEGATSAHQYFADQSNGKYTPQFDVYGPYTLANNRKYYGGNDYNGNDQRLGEMVAEGCEGLNSKIDFSKYDNDGDGVCDVVIVLYAGDGEASSYEDDAEDSVWPCQWDLYSSDYGKTLRLDNTYINSFAVFNEANGQNINKIDGVGTFCHEFSHCMGLPDFYDTNYGGHFGMAHWSLMDYGSYNNDGYTPIGYSAYEKEFMGWIEIPEVEENTYYTLPVFNQKNIETDQAVKITNSKNKNEYYVIENRARQGWDKYMPADGLLIYHVDYLESAWTQNCVNDYDTQRMSPIPADNELKISKYTYYGQTYYEVDETSLLGDLWPNLSHNATELTDTSTPAASVHTGGYMGKPITEMERNSDGTISFWAMKAPIPSVSKPHSLTHIPEDVDAVTLSWQPGDDTDVTYTIDIKNHKEVTCTKVMEADFSADDQGWNTTDGYAKVEDGAFKLGSGKQMGTIVSPAFNTDESGIVSVVFNAKYYGSDGSSVGVSLLDNRGNEIDYNEIDLGASYDTYTVYFETRGISSAKVAFSCIQNKKRLYIRDAVIYNGLYEEGALRAAGTSVQADDDDFSLTVNGHNTTSYTIRGIKPGVIYECRVKAVPNDAESFMESPWSETYSFEHTGTTTVTITLPTVETAHYYTLQGIYLGTKCPAAPGIYIRKTTERVEKLNIR
ncbi:MAG: M6 family metalloprotease domain-containing protein [Muribaculaceae bacterium]|nr:M6 family metalloprotease domain-containing protein [Muribaculaceae bacterium]